MRTLLCVSLVLLFASTATAQFGTAAAREKAAAGAPKPADKPANPGVDPANGVAAANGGTPDKLFAALDLDGDGVISKAEIKKAIVSLKKLDTDNDGAITLAECGGGGAAAAPAGVAVANNDPATQAIDQLMALDKNKDGKLTANELSDNEKQMLQGADLNNDKAIDRQELEALQAKRANQDAFAAGQNGNAGGGRANNEAMGMFLQYDRNHDGRLTTDEVPQQAVQSMSIADINRDGVIDAAEFQAMAARMGNAVRGPLGAGMKANGPIGVNQTLENNNRNRNRN